MRKRQLCRDFILRFTATAESDDSILASIVWRRLLAKDLKTLVAHLQSFVIEIGRFLQSAVEYS